ncbi:MAG: DUF6089 family protein [Vicingaceae bacterium]
MRKIVTIVFALGLFHFANGQFNQDYGFHLGMATHMGDIGGPNEPAQIQASRIEYVIGGFYRYKFASKFYAKGALSYGRISGADSYSKDPVKIARNLSFRTTLIEVAGTVEYHFLDIKDFGGTGRYNTFLNVYVFAGIGVTHFTPMAETDGGEWVKLQPLKTEGVDYGQITPIIPFGIGSHMTFDRKWRVGVEIGARPTFTDYLDDVHDKYMTEEQFNASEPLAQEMYNRVNDQYVEDAIASGIVNWAEGYEMGGFGKTRGGNKADDWYFFGTASVSWLIRGKSNFYRAKYSFAKGHRYKKRRSRAKF